MEMTKRTMRKVFMGQLYGEKTHVNTKSRREDQHHQLFQIRCTINSKLFELIINSGSCENIINREAVKVLKLPVEKHHNPYTIGGIKATENLKVKVAN